MGHHQEKVYGETINLGTQYEISIEDLAHSLIKLFDRDVEIVCKTDRFRPKKSEVERLLSNNQKAKTRLNWSPLYSGEHGLTKGLQMTKEWFTNPDNIRFYKADLFNV